MTSSHRIYNPFEKGYVLKWTHELFVVRKCVPSTPPIYELSNKMGEPIKGKFYAQELQSVSPPESYRIEKIVRSQRGNNGKSDTTFAGLAIQKNSIAGSTRSTTSIKTAMAARECNKSKPRIFEFLTVYKIVASFLIVIVSLLNLSLSDRNKALWSTLVGAGFSYLVPNPRFERVGGCGSGNDESIHYLVAQQQLDGPLPGQQSIAMEDETG